ncbi:ribosomal RNA large subunit methyltransferase H [Clostridia bacterium]|nr:ribosomal RNA large subunit methyltransferase H [Clostridia bacterium]
MNIICVGTLKEPYLRDAQKFYLSKLRNITITELKESDDILRHIKKTDNVAVLTVEKLSKPFEYNDENATIIIGGSNGLPDSVKKRASGYINFSDMTFTHQWARIVLLERLCMGVL